MSKVILDINKSTFRSCAALFSVLFLIFSVNLYAETAFISGQFSQPTPGQIFSPGSDVPVTIEANAHRGIKQIKLFLNNEFLRQERFSPYEWANADFNDQKLRNLNEGMYKLTAQIEDKSGYSTTIEQQFNVMDLPKPGNVGVFTSPLANQRFLAGSDVPVVIETEHAELIQHIKLYLNKQFVRQENFLPYEWANPTQKDPLLRQMQAGQYDLRAVITYKSGGQETLNQKFLVADTDAACLSKNNTLNNTLKNPSLSDKPTVDSGPLVSYNRCGKLQYRTHAAINETRPLLTVPDFSHAGYHGGGVEIPNIPVLITLEPLRSKDDTQHIQAAIDRVSRMPLNQQGFRGAILLKAGEYDVSDTLTISASGVVIKGESQARLTNGGTLIRATTTAKIPLIQFQGDKNYTTRSQPFPITDDYVPVGAYQITLETLSEGQSTLKVGDKIAIQRTPNDLWIKTVRMDDLGSDAPWKDTRYHIAHIRTIKSINNNTLTLDMPIVDSMQAQYGGAQVFKVDIRDRLQHCGIEDIRLVSDFNLDLKDPQGEWTDEDHATMGVVFNNTQHCWVRRMTAAHFAKSAVLIKNSSHNTIEEVAAIDFVSKVRGGARYPLYIEGASSANLFQRCYASRGRHNFVTGSRVTGPNVWLDCLAENSINDDGPHHRWATGLLFDNIQTLQLRVQNRYNSGSGHGWSGAQVMFWNPQITALAQHATYRKQPDIILDAAPTTMSWLVGTPQSNLIKPGTRSPYSESQGIIEYYKAANMPRSLYLAQLQDRLGTAAVNAITLPPQRTGTLWQALKAWKGDGELSDFLQ